MPSAERVRLIEWSLLLETESEAYKVVTYLVRLERVGLRE